MTLRGPAPEYAPNPDYGRGAYRRRILLENRPGEARGALEDTNHGFRVTVRHDGEVVTAIEPEAVRIPFTTCPGAAERLKALLGCSIRGSARDLTALAGANSNCTHLLDLTILAIRHAASGEARRQWDVTVTDETEDGDSIVSVDRDGEHVFEWHARHFYITQPEALQGRPLYLGFGRWASDYFEEEALEAAFIMQKGYFVAQARRFDLSAAAGEPAALSGQSMEGACYTYTRGVMERGERTADSTRDFSESAELLLKFV